MASQDEVTTDSTPQLSSSTPEYSSRFSTSLTGKSRRRKKRKRIKSFAVWRHHYLIRFLEFCRNVSRMWLSSIIVFLSFILFSIMGAFIFKQIEEQPNEEERRENANKINAMIDGFFLLTKNRSIDDVIWRHDMAERMKELSGAICSRDLLEQIISGNVQSVWTIENAIYFCVCVFTTIGYGDIVPTNPVGRMVTIIYAFFGIPFWLTLVAKFGNVMNNYVKTGMYYTNLWFYGDIKKQQQQEEEEGEKEEPHVHRYEKKIYEKIVEFKGASPHLYAANFDLHVKLLTIAQGSRPVNYKEFYKTIRAIDKHQLEKERSSFRIPIKIPLILMIFYIIAGALALTFTEEWNYLDSIYYVFITLLTIGYGDIVPNKTHKIIFCVYVLIGMSLFSFFFAVTFDSVENIMTKIKEALQNEGRKQWANLHTFGQTAMTAIKKETKTFAVDPRQFLAKLKPDTPKRRRSDVKKS